MSEDLPRKRLGRGLAALIGEMDHPVEAAAPLPADRTVRLENLVPNPRNPRRTFPEAELVDLAQSIREHGLVQPVVVRREAGNPDGNRFEIIAGERRWRAARMAGLTEIPVLVRDVNDRVALEMAIVENVQRSDLNPIEEAHGYQLLVEQHGYTQANLADVIGKSRSHVANTLRLLRLHEVIRDMLESGQLSAGHARALITADDPVGLASRIVEEGLSVRQAEELAQGYAGRPARQPRAPAAEKDADTSALEKQLADVTGLKVAIQHRGAGGEVRIAYRTLDQLDELCRRLTK
ncbi:MAG: ParB/RepB/Spo0J family partition protein [Mesorhizobium sp.]|jgi:ParB family chromosome partitioning protein